MNYLEYNLIELIKKNPKDWELINFNVYKCISDPKLYIHTSMWNGFDHYINYENALKLISSTTYDEIERILKLKKPVLSTNDITINDVIIKKIKNE